MQDMVHELRGGYLDTLEHECDYYPSTVEVMAIAESLKADVRVVQFSPAWGLEEVHRSSLGVGGHPCP
eukprot:9043474-Pyramimonas_sp.AAC.1